MQHTGCSTNDHLSAFAVNQQFSIQLKHNLNLIRSTSSRPSRAVNWTAELPRRSIRESILNYLVGIPYSFSILQCHFCELTLHHLKGVDDITILELD